MTGVLVLLARALGASAASSPCRTSSSRSCRCPRRASDLHAYETPLLVVSVALALAGLAGAAFLFGGAAERAERLRSRFAGAAPRGCRASTSSTSCTTRVIGRPLVWVSDRVFLRFGDRAPARRHAARPGRARPRQRGACSAACRPAASTSTPGSCSSASSARCSGAGVMSDAGVLNLVLFLPLLGIGLLVALPARIARPRAAADVRRDGRQFALAAWLYARFDNSVAGLQFETRLPWIAPWGVNYQIGLDGYNVLLVMLTAFLGPLVVAGAFTAITQGREALLRDGVRGPVRDDGHLPRAGPLPLLRLLGSDDDPDVPAHRHLGRRAPHLRDASSSFSTPRSAAS